MSYAKLLENSEVEQRLQRLEAALQARPSSNGHIIQVGAP
jgi:hypothetical protein